MSAPRRRRGSWRSATASISATYSIIYEVADDVEKLVKRQGRAEGAREVPGLCRGPQGVQHHQDRQGRGLHVTEGLVKRGAGVRVLRDNVVIHTANCRN